MTEAPAFLYHGAVSHRRLRPFGRRFSYRVFSMLIDLDRLDEANRSLRLFSFDRFNLFSLFGKDHAGGGAAPLGARVRTILRNAGFRGDGRIQLLCYPRILGYVFNPLSIYYCGDAAGRLEAVLYEVRNTFGEMHSYLIAAGGDAPVLRQAADKAFRVSPFMDIDQRYHFRLTRPGETIAAMIHQTDREGPILNAAFAGRREEMTDAALFRAFFRYPLMTVKIILAIHVEALGLFLRGLRLKPAPRAPQAPITVIGAPPLAHRGAAPSRVVNHSARG